MVNFLTDIEVLVGKKVFGQKGKQVIGQNRRSKRINSGFEQLEHYSPANKVRR